MAFKTLLRPFYSGLVNTRAPASLKNIAFIIWDSNTNQLRRNFGSNIGYHQQKQVLRNAHLLQNRLYRSFEQIASLQGVRYQSTGARSTGFGISDQVLKSNVSQEEGKNQDQSKDEEEKKQQENAARALKYSLYALGSMILGSGVYVFFVWGAPLRDEDGNELKDEFSSLSFINQYYSRCVSELSNYATSLAEPSREKLLPDPLKMPYYQPPYTLLIELTGVLVHPEWTYKTGWRFKKRPGVEYFLKQLANSQLFEIVIYTQESGFTGFPIVQALDTTNVVAYQLFRDSTRYVDGRHIKDLDRVNRDLSKVIMVDCNPEAVKSHRNSALILPRWNGNDDDRTLFDLASLLQTISSSDVGDIRIVLDHYSNFLDPISEFREKRRILVEQEEERERMIINLKKTGPGAPGLSFIPSFLKRS